MGREVVEEEVVVVKVTVKVGMEEVRKWIREVRTQVEGGGGVEVVEVGEEEEVVVVEVEVED